jgi:ParB/RepB/Spo0J family partition protein
LRLVGFELNHKGKVEQSKMSTQKIQTLLEGVNPNDCNISRFNARKTRPQEDVDRLAERIKTNGYETTRAVWACHGEEGNLEIFAGGTRLAAAKQAQCSISVILFEGYTDDEIVKLSEQDNEDDEYHQPVPILDVWADYARLHDEEGWTQERIAKAKGITQAMVSLRLRLHALPDTINQFINQGLLKEAHLIEISQIQIDLYFLPWLTDEQAWQELAEWAGNGHTVRDTKKRVSQWKQFIELADKAYQGFEETTLYNFEGDKPEPYQFDARQAFVDALAGRKARSQATVTEAKNQVTIKIAENLDKYKIWVNKQTAKAAREAIKAQRQEELLSKVHQGDFRDLLAKLPSDSVDLIFTDPPYGEDHIKDYGDLAHIAARILKPGGSLIAYAGHYALPRIFEEMCPHLRFWWLLAVKHGGGLSSLTGKKVYVQWKPLVWFVKGEHSGEDFVFDLVDSAPPEKELHEWEQSAKEATYYIKGLTNEGDLVIDPLAGSGTTIMAALESKRDFWACDCDEDAIGTIKNRLLDWIEREE